MTPWYIDGYGAGDKRKLHWRLKQVTTTACSVILLKYLERVFCGDLTLSAYIYKHRQGPMSTHFILKMERERISETSTI
jgi:hypothetical protein